MTSGLPCPATEILESHAAGTCPPADALRWDAHLADCPSCLARFLNQLPPALYPPIPDCRIVREIGRGRFGVVYKAWWMTSPPRLVALKLLSSMGAMEAGRFDREIAVLERIRSPGIVHCLFAGRSAETRYYLMDYVAGVHLDEYCAAYRDDLIAQLTMFQKVCRAVADAHEQGVVHRDLKPGNILVDAQANPQILDFGICTVASDEWTSWAKHTLTHPGDVIGTLKYMSPEQAWGGVAGSVTARSDVWALGIILHEIVTKGGYPYPLGSTPERPAHEALLDRIRKELPRPARLDALPRGRDLEVLLQRSLAWEPHRRLDSARTLANDLEHYCRGQRIQTQPFPLPYRLQRLAVGAAVRSRWTFSLLFMAAVGFALSLGGWMLNIGWRVQGHEYRAGRGRATPLFVDGDAREGIVPVGIGDETPGAVVRFAADRGAEFGGVTEDVTTWRAVHGFLLQRLSGAKPKAAVWDFYFQPPRPADDRLAAGITALERAGVPVVLAALEYEDDGTPRLSPAIVAALGRSLRHGAIVARDMVDAPGEVIVSVKRNEHTVIPSLVLATLAALLHPEERLDLEWPERSYTLAMLYETSTGSYLREQDRLELTKVFRGDRAEGAAVPKSLLGSIRFVLDPPDRWEARTVSYESLLTASDDELRRRCAGKLVIFGNLRTRRTDPHPDRHDVQYPSGMVSGVPGCYLIADAIAGLLDRRYMQAAFPLRPGTYFPLLLLAAAGCLAPIRLATAQVFDRRRNRCAFGLAAAALAAGGWLLSSVSGSWWAVHLGLAFFAFLAPLTGSLWVEFARGRHRILEAGRRELELATPTANEGTVTLASPPGIPRRETR